MDVRLTPGCTLAARPGPGRFPRRCTFVCFDEGNSDDDWLIVVFDGETQQTAIPADRVTTCLAVENEPSDG